MNRRAFWSGGAIIGALSLVFLVGCGTEEEGPLSFEGTLLGASEVPPVATGATGTVQVSLVDQQLELRGTFSTLESDLLDVAGSPAHVHQAPANAAGPIVFNVGVTSADRRNGAFALSRTLTTEEDSLLRAGNYYLNIHTASHSTGEIRVQLTQEQPGRITTIPDFTGSNEVPPVTTSATGLTQDDSASR